MTHKRLSQHYLKLLETCPRKFQYSYFEQLLSPIDPELQKRQQWGQEFHLLMQQKSLGLPIESILDQQPQFKQWFTGLITVAPEIFADNDHQQRYSEHLRTLMINNYLFTVIYDLLITEQEKAVIYDWKTYPSPPKSEKLYHHWQTRLYLYLLVETSSYEPEQLSMVYWFVQSQPQPQSLVINYDRSQHQQTQADLHRILQQLNQWETAYLQGESLPQISENQGHCKQCNFITRCQRSPELSAAKKAQKLPNFATIKEVIL